MSKPAPKRNEPCPCGSGLKYKQCCEGKQKILPGKYRGVPYWMLGVIGIAVLGAGLWVISQMTGASSSPQQVAANTGTASSVQGPPGQPWEFDESNNRHYDPNHGHWHDGAPPANPTQSSPNVPPTLPSSAPTPNPTSSSPFGTRPGGQPIAGQTTPGQPAPHQATPLDPSQPTPEAWSYNTDTDKHFDPTHNHWHNGPAPFQYDPATNRYWDPDHNHWHNGPAPSDAARADGSAPPKPQSGVTGHDHDH